MAQAFFLLSKMMANRPDQDLTTHLRQQAEEKDDPWKKRRAALRRRTAGWETEFHTNTAKAWNDLRHHFAKAGYNQLLTEEVATELAYILEASPLQQYQRARALLNLSSTDRLALHNFNVAEARGESFAETWGPTVDILPVPLFPATNDHEDTNQKLLAQMTNYTVTGAGPATRPKLTIFARAQPITAAGHKVPVLDGQVDIGIVEEEFGLQDAKWTETKARLEARIEALESNRGRGRNRNNNNNNGNRGGRGNNNRGGQGYNNQAPQYNDYPYEHNNQNQYNNHNNNQNQYNNNNNNNQYNNRGNNRGRGVRGRGGQDHAFEEGNDNGPNRGEGTQEQRPWP
jgi:hypothetical protein